MTVAFDHPVAMIQAYLFQKDGNVIPERHVNHGKCNFGTNQCMFNSSLSMRSVAIEGSNTQTTTSQSIIIQRTQKKTIFF